MNRTQLVDEILRQLTVEVEASGRHVHLSPGDTEYLFGPGHSLTPVKDLSQPGQFACRERVKLIGPKGTLGDVVVLGPSRGESQVEISLTDGVALGVRPPVRQSGDLAGTPGILLEYGGRRLSLSQGLIVAQRHVHLTPQAAARWGVTHGQTVSLQCLTDRPVVFGGAVVRVSEKFSPAVHLDYDEANAAGWKKGDRAVLLP